MLLITLKLVCHPFHQLDMLFTLDYRSLYGPAVCVFQETFIGIWHPRHEREYPSCYSALDGVIRIIAGPSGERHPLVHRKEFPERHPALY